MLLSWCWCCKVGPLPVHIACHEEMGLPLPQQLCLVRRGMTAQHLHGGRACQPLAAFQQRAAGGTAPHRDNKQVHSTLSA